MRHLFFPNSIAPNPSSTIISTLSTVVASTPATDTTVSSHLGAIIGGAVGVALVGAIIVFWVSLMRRKMGGLIALKKKDNVIDLLHFKGFT